MQIKHLKYCLIVLVFSTIFLACSKMEDTYKEFVKGGEIYYPGKAEELTVYPGRNRMALSWLLTSDPKISKTVVFWNNRADSVVIPVKRTSGVDTIRRTIPSLPEGTYSFEVYTYDAKGNRSVKVETIGNTYGNNYDISLVNRPIESAKMQSSTSTIALISWYPASSQLLGMDLRYKNAMGDSVSRYIHADSLKTTLTNFTKGNAFIYRSLFKPEPKAIDTFYTNFESQTISN